MLGRWRCLLPPTTRSRIEMSRDFYSDDPRDARDTTSRRPRRHHDAETSDVRTNRGSGDPPQVGREAPESRDKHGLKPEREDSPRAYYVRDRAYLLRESELRTLAEVGRFRVVTRRTLRSTVRRRRRPYGPGHRAAEGQWLLKETTLEISQKKTLRVLTLTKPARSFSGKPAGSQETRTFITVW